MLFHHTGLSHSLTITFADFPVLKCRWLTGDSVVIVTVVIISVADPRCYPGSQILIFYLSWIQQQQQKGRGENLVVLPNFVATNFTKLKIMLFLNSHRKNLSQLTKIYTTFYPKIVTKLLKIWVGDPGSRIQGSKGTRYGSATLLLQDVANISESTKVVHTVGTVLWLRKFGKPSKLSKCRAVFMSCYIDMK